jgi:MFS family permease
MGAGGGESSLLRAFGIGRGRRAGYMGPESESGTMSRSVSIDETEAEKRLSIGFLNWAHAIDHFVLLIFPTVVIGLEVVYRRPYSELIALSSAAFIAFGVFALPAGWLADRWSRRNMMAAFYFGCGVSLLGAAWAPDLMWLGAALFALGIFAAIYHPVGMAMLIEASGARGRTLAFNGVCGNLGVSLAAGVSAVLAAWFGWRAAFLVPAVVCIISGFVYVWLTPNDRHSAKTRKSIPAVRLSTKAAATVFGLFIIIALSGGLTFNVLTIALPKIVDEKLAGGLPLVVVGSVATAVLVCGALAQLSVGRLVERFTPITMFFVITGIGFLGNLWAAYSAGGVPMMFALALAIAAIYGQVTVNDMVLARYTADAWRGRVYAVRYFLLFITSGAAVGLIALLHKAGGFSLVMTVNTVIALLLFIATGFLFAFLSSIETKQAVSQPAE